MSKKQDAELLEFTQKLEIEVVLLERMVSVVDAVIDGRMSYEDALTCFEDISYQLSQVECTFSAYALLESQKSMLDKWFEDNSAR